MNNGRVDEIFEKQTALSNHFYFKDDYLDEMLLLQTQQVEITFNKEHAERSSLRFWDVYNHLDKLNSEKGHIADSELEKYKSGVKKVSNLIMSEISGRIGERKVLQEIENLNCTNEVLYNVEFEFDGKHTEIDALVFTNRAIFLIEVKNSKKDIFIDKFGNFYRTGDNMHHDGNIAHKFEEREMLLRRILERAGIDNPNIFKILVFTNPKIDVENKYRYVKVCGYNYLPIFIEKFYSEHWYSYEEISNMVASVEEAKCQIPYQMSIDMDEFKLDFARLMAKLEESEVKDDICDESVVSSAEVCVNSHDSADDMTQNGKSAHKPISIGKSAVAAAIGLTVVNIALFGVGLFFKNKKQM